MGVKSSVQRDEYVAALADFVAAVPPEEWPTAGGRVSRSGIERALRARGFSRFDRKRLLSPGCRKILDAMDTQLLNSAVLPTKPIAEPSGADVRLMRSLERRLRVALEALDRSTKREKRLERRCELLSAEVDAVRRKKSAFEAHCEASLRSLYR